MAIVNNEARLIIPLERRAFIRHNVDLNNRLVIAVSRQNSNFVARGQSIKLMFRVIYVIVFCVRVVSLDARVLGFKYLPVFQLVSRWKAELHRACGLGVVYVGNRSRVRGLWNVAWR